jgi:hypothetical protein
LSRARNEMTTGPPTKTGRPGTLHQPGLNAEIG